jgi:hypothetical protein
MTLGTTGGRTTQSDVERLQRSVRAVADGFGYQPRSHCGKSGTAFDRAVAPILTKEMNLSWDEAGQPSVWSFVALVALPDLTEWRWGGTADRSKERWVCTDPTRHAWGRLWWQETLCRSNASLLDQFQESELNQLFERTSFTRNPAMFLTFAEAIASRLNGPVARRTFVRDVTKRMRRRLAFVDSFALAPDELDSLVKTVVEVVPHRVV